MNSQESPFLKRQKFLENIKLLRELTKRKLELLELLERAVLSKDARELFGKRGAE